MTTKMKKTAPHSKTRAHQIYKLIDGTRVPGVTTIIGSNLGWNKNALIAWARREALAGNDPNKIKDQAADIGTCAHYLIECYFKNIEPDMSEYSAVVADKAENCYLAFLEWAKPREIKIVATEDQLVSETFKFGGTLDLIAYIDGVKCLVDYKSSKGVYSEMLIQLAAYQYLWAGKHHKRLPCYLLHLGKEDGSFAPYYYPIDALNSYWQIFRHLTEIHYLKKTLN